ncbi:MAG: hypothetical protein KatS3mg110_0227 [Pirellulaceae bacterium]|nr:MAG: hypothetical protein KatS3mg110_0227 [Pirellulaceae bacterium]
MNGPTPETQTYLAHLSRDHQHLRQELLRVASTLERLQDSEQLALAADQLAGLLDFLRRHFADEEEAGALVESRDYCPAVSAEVGRILAEHAELLRLLDRTVAQLRSHATLSAEYLEKIRRDFAQFCQRMEDHELAEKAVVARAFGAVPD